ncbi:major facilitator superfamily domain-containing protein [Aspergillus crustosus]
MSGFLARLEVATRWFPKDMPQAERRLVRKLDMLVLPYACLSFSVKYLDVSALTNAYVSGMKEDLDLSGNRLNYINAAFEVGYVVFQTPSNLVLIKYPAQYYLPFAEIFWDLFTLGTAFVQTYEQLVVMRFFVGLSATSCYVGLYRKHELGRRNALFWIANPLGQMIAGYLQAAAYTHLNNNHGLGFFIFPDMPERTKSRFLTDDDKALALKRLSKTLFRRFLTSWRAYSFVILLIIFCKMTYCEGTPFILWLDSQPEKYSVSLPIILSCVLCVFANLVLSIWQIPDGLKFFAYISVGWSYGTIPMLIAWTAEGRAGDLEVRAIALASYNTFCGDCRVVCASCCMAHKKTTVAEEQGRVGADDTDSDGVVVEQQTPKV